MSHFEPLERQKRDSLSHTRNPAHHCLTKVFACHLLSCHLYVRSRLVCITVIFIERISTPVINDLVSMMWHKMLHIATVSFLIMVGARGAQMSSSGESSDDAHWPNVACPQKCRCSLTLTEKFQARLRTADCSDSDIYEFPADFPSDVQMIILKNNHVQRLSIDQSLRDLIILDLSHNFLQQSPIMDESRRELFNLKLLDLSFNRLEKLDDFQFEGLFNLEELNLADNSLFSINDRSFLGLNKLETLKLSGNRLPFFENVWWKNLPNLHNLYADRNRFTFLQADAFKLLPNLMTLDLSKNKLYRINDRAFTDLIKLETLNLNSNFLIQVPRESLTFLKSIKSINLGRNAIFKLRKDDFCSLYSLRDLTLSNMQRLRLVEKGAFNDLPGLLLVDLHDNPYLSYLDPESFIKIEQLSHLHLHNNNLTVLERDTVDSLPALQEISFYGNPLLCDCNSRWLNKLLTDVTVEDRKIVFSEADRIVCDGPKDHRFKLFTTLTPGDLPRVCPPRILHLFDSTTNRKSGDDIAYDCRAVGLPRPRITWVESSGRPASREQTVGGTLILRRLKTSDGGPYACIAENDVGNDVRQTILNVTAMQIELNIERLTSTSARVVWTGADRDNHIFQLQYRRATVDTNEQTASLDHRMRYATSVTPIMKSYTLENLRPDTSYEICISYEDDQDVLVQIFCAKFHTHTAASSRNVVAAALRRNGNLALGAALAALSCVLIVLSFVALKLKSNVVGRRELSAASALMTPNGYENGNFYTFSTDDLSKSCSKHSLLDL
uniref:Ig-like domain-containing protein n=1 Tax=Romanomermis culicivorax TaxID=13658 RepID=A0A915K7J1_ROMCU